MNGYKNMHELARMKRSDIASILVMESLCFTTPWSRQAFETELVNPAARYFVLRLVGQPIAYGGYWYAMDEGYITNIAVHPNHQGQGLGRGLLRALLEDMTAHGIVRTTLEVRASNTRAQGLYLSEGFTRCGIRKGYYPDNNEDAWVMLRTNKDGNAG